MITIQNEKFSASIAPLGAELKSLKNRETGEEFIWQADPTVWGKSAPILFPITGLLKEDKTTIGGVEYAIPKHGFARERLFEVLEQSESSVLFQLVADAQMRAVYPYDFTLQVGFELQGNQLVVNYRILNTGAEEMLFSIGSHPAFALDLEQAALSDYYLEFSHPETLDLYGLTDNFFAKKQDRFLDGVQQLALSPHTFDDDALMFKNMASQMITLRRRHSDWALELDRRNAPHLGIWAKPNAAFVCIEPWLSYNDAADSDGCFEHKPGIIPLAAGNLFESGYTVRVNG